jgi:hypothetical protein
MSSAIDETSLYKLQFKYDMILSDFCYSANKLKKSIMWSWKVKLWEQYVQLSQCFSQFNRRYRYINEFNK